MQLVLFLMFKLYFFGKVYQEVEETTDDANANETPENNEGGE